MQHRRAPFQQGILIDQGLQDQFLKDQLLPLAFERACIEASQPHTLRMHEGYDHSYYFVSSFMEDHIAFHMRVLNE
jgi:S-formylglutathione hydrolase